MNLVDVCAKLMEDCKLQLFDKTTLCCSKLIADGWKLKKFYWK